MIGYIKLLNRKAFTPEEHSLYSRWHSMIGRCKRKTDASYYRYGARGIKVCKRWRDSFENYAKDVGMPPGPNYDLDRINNDGDYEPSNVRWVTTQQNLCNYSRNVRVTIDGETKLVSEWADQYGISRAAFTYRMQRGWTGRQLIQFPQKKVNFTTINGVTKPDMQWAKEIGISHFGFRMRKAAGDTGDYLLRPSQKKRRPTVDAVPVQDSTYVVPAPRPA